MNFLYIIATGADDPAGTMAIPGAAISAMATNKRITQFLSFGRADLLD